MTECGPGVEIQKVGERSVDLIKKEKEKVDLNSQLNSMVEGICGFNTETFYERTIDEPLNKFNEIDFGDYGKYRFTNDYQLNTIFNGLDMKTNDDNGSKLTVEGIREAVKSCEDDHPVLVFSGKEGIKINFDFFAGKNESAFHTRVININDDQRRNLREKISEVPADQWGKLLGERINGEREIILNSRGLYRISDDHLNNLRLNDDTLFFWERFSFKLPKVSEYKDMTLEQVKQALDGSNNNKIRLESRVNKGAYFEITKVDGMDNMVNMELVLDLESLSGRENKNRFVVSKTADDLMTVFDKCGIKISGDVLNAVSEGSLGIKSNSEFSNRYGNGYADLTRILSYCIRYEDRKDVLKKLFEKFDENKLKDLTEGMENLTGPAKLVLEMINDLIDSSRGQKESDFNFWKSDRTSVRDGSCKDVEVYYEMALEGYKYKKDENFFYQKTHEGTPTAITRKGLNVSGVNLPRGFLCRVGPDGVEPLRPTMFCFNKVEAVDAFGQQYWDLLDDFPGLENLIEINSDEWQF